MLHLSSGTYLSSSLSCAGYLSSALVGAPSALQLALTVCMQASSSSAAHKSGQSPSTLLGSVCHTNHCNGQLAMCLPYQHACCTARLSKSLCSMQADWQNLI